VLPKIKSVREPRFSPWGKEQSCGEATCKRLVQQTLHLFSTGGGGETKKSCADPRYQEKEKKKEVRSCVNARIERGSPSEKRTGGDTMKIRQLSTLEFYRWVVLVDRN